MLKVIKFGGSSLADANQFKKVAAIIKAEPERRYVVASAPGKRNSADEKVTDLLLQCYEINKSNNSIDEIFEKIANRYREIIKDLELDFSLEKDFDKIKTIITNYAGRDFVASRGEYLNAKLLAKYIGFEFVDAQNAVFFDEKGMLDTNKTNEVLGEILKNTPYAVIPGFYGTNPNGTIKTFSRGGSDITGSIVASAVNADIYENWTDVSGMLMADPRVVEDPKPIDLITYAELRELSYMGASVMHEDAIFPVRQSGIPINIRNTNDPSANGTMIVPCAGDSNPSHLITGIAGKKGFSAISIEKSMMNAEVGFGRKVLEVLEDYGISFEHLPSGIDTMTVVLNTAALEPYKAEVLENLKRVVNPDSVTVVNNLATIAVVGRGMAGAPGTAARVFKALAESNINIRMIDQGSSELSIIISIHEDNYVAALNAIYKEFMS